VAVRRDGDTFQARLFWLKGRLLDPEGPIVRVGFESGPKGYDDIWTEYDPHRGLNDQEGRPLYREHIQCKWGSLKKSPTPDSVVVNDSRLAGARYARAQAAESTGAIYYGLAQAVHSG
jgi:hypothetical protein